MSCRGACGETCLPALLVAYTYGHAEPLERAQGRARCGSRMRPPCGVQRTRILFDNRVYRKCEGQPVGCSLPIDVKRLSEGIQDGIPCVSRDGIRRGA